MNTPYQELLDAAHDLLNEIETSDYEDMVHSSERVNRLKEVSGWPSKVRVYGEPAPTWLNSKPMDGRIMVKNTGAKPSRDYFDIHTYTGDNSAARKNFEETVEVLPPMGCISLAPGESLVMKSKKKFFEVVVSNKVEVDAELSHGLGCEPYVIIGRADGFGWFGWKRDCIGQPVIIENNAGKQEFPYLSFKHATDVGLVLDTSAFKGTSYFYLFSEDGFAKVEDYISQEKNNGGN